MLRNRVLPLALLLPLAGVVATTTACPDGGEGEGEGDERGRAIDRALRQGKEVQKRIGKGKGRGNTALDELLAPTVNWREQLREFVTNVTAGKDMSTWRRPNRRFIADNIYMPSSISETMGELVIACDTSGSIGQRELTQFLSECKVIFDSVRPARVRLLYWDTTVCADETIS